MFGGVGGGGMGGYMMPAGGFWIQTVLDKTAFTQASQSMAMLGTEMKILGRDFMIAGGLIAAPMVLAAKEASRATVIQRAFNAVFREGTAEASRFVNQMARGTGRFTVDLQESLMSIQALFRGMNFGDQSTGLAQFTQGLMTDLASFRGLTDQDVMQRFVSTLSGSVEAMDQLGIDVHEHAIQQELLAMGINKSVQEASEQEKIMARLNVIHKAMGQQGAIGASTRAMNEFDGQIIQLNTSLKSLQQNLGDALKPMLEDVLPPARDIISTFSDWIKFNPEIVQGIGQVAASLAVMGGAMWTAGAAWRVLGFGLSVFGSPMMMAIGAAGYGLVRWAGAAASAAVETERLRREAEALAKADLTPVQQEMWDDLGPKRATIERLKEFRDEAVGMLEYLNFAGLGDELGAPLERKIAEAQRAIEKLGMEVALAEQHIREGMSEKDMKGVSKDIGKNLEDDIADGIHKGFLRGIEGTFSSLSQRMFANQFAESVGITIAGGRENGRGGKNSDRIKTEAGDAAGEFGTRRLPDGTIVPAVPGDGPPARQPRQFRPPTEFERDANGNPIVPDEYLPPIGRDYSAGLPEQYQVKPEGEGFMVGDYYSTEPGHPDGSTANPLTNPATGEWRMRGKPGANRYGTFTPYNQGPNYNYDGNIPQGSTEAGTDPRTTLDEDRLEREFIPPQEPRYQEDTTLINEVREQVKNLRGLQDAILDLVTALSNPETFQQRYE